jgi:hypothetical protein
MSPLFLLPEKSFCHGQGFATMQNHELRILSETPRQAAFRAIPVHLSNGEVHPVRYPSCAALTRSRLVITDPDADRIVVCALLHVASVDLLQPAA